MQERQHLARRARGEPGRRARRRGRGGRRGRQCLTPPPSRPPQPGLSRTGSFGMRAPARPADRPSSWCPGVCPQRGSRACSTRCARRRGGGSPSGKRLRGRIEEVAKFRRALARGPSGRTSACPRLSARGVASHWPEVLQDQPALGCPIAEEVPRTSRGSGSGYRQHHARRTFVSIARANGARPDVVRWVIHGPTGFGHGRLHDAALGIPLPCGGLLEGRAKDRRGDTEEARGKRGSSRSH